jgi:hypothetical protein
MLKFVFGFVLTLSFSARSFANETKAEWNLVELCKKDCPKATNDEEAHRCAEKVGKLNKEFRKGKCWESNEKYEASKEKAH